MSGQFQKLNGIKIVKLTDRKYMQELRQKIAEEYVQKLMQRISLREQQEKERERIMFLEGKCSNNDVIFKDKGNEFKLQRKSKVKSVRQRNAERLIRLHKKWVKKYGNGNLNAECSSDEDDEKSFANSATKNVYRKSHSDVSLLGLEELLKDNNMVSIPCENRFLKPSNSHIDDDADEDDELVGYESDTVFDIKNIVYARREFRNTEKKSREELNIKSIKYGMKFKLIKNLLVIASARSKKSRRLVVEKIKKIESEEIYQENNEIEKLQKEEEFKLKVAKLKHNPEAFYEDKKITELKKANGVKELYNLAESIVLGEFNIYETDAIENNNTESDGS